MGCPGNEEGSADEKVPPIPGSMRNHWRAKYQAHPLVSQHPALDKWVQGLVDGGQLARRWKSHPERMRDVLDILDALEYAKAAEKPVPLQLLGIRLEGNAHAFDSDEPLGRLLTEAIGALWDYSPAHLRGVLNRREAYAKAKIHLDSVSSTVLLAGFRFDATGERLPERLTVAAESSLPTVLTLKEVLETAPPGFAPSTQTISCCENPAVLEAALIALRQECPPILCLGGRPSAAGLVMLERLKAGGAHLRFHGDYDWTGLAIAEHLERDYEAESWLFDSQCYKEHLPAALWPLKKKPEAPRGPQELVEALTEGCYAVYEEQCLDELVGSLRKLAGAD